MNLIIDIGHPAQLNFLKIAIERLALKHTVFVSYLNRGKLPVIMRRELSKFTLVQVGEHRGSLYSILVHANFLRLLEFMRFIIMNRIDLGINGGVPLGLALKFLGRKHIQFDDDIERKLTIFLEIITSDKLIVFPDYQVTHISRKWKNLQFVHSLKEWAYLSPAYYKPDSSIPQAYGLTPGSYIFLREVSNKTVNYMGHESGLICKYQQTIDSLQLKVILSLEDKSTQEQYPENWTILQEPVDDIHSLMYFSRYVISSGDSMAREGAMLGVVSIYCGFRDMIANRYIQEFGLLFWVKSEPDMDVVFSNKLIHDQEAYRRGLLESWIDVNDLIVSTINNYDRR
ncbi:MAG TPA: DUF354 domain-containing protein [Candidatus Cloacimonadota bacterium]|nr:DUF354 domain-containing protein [Candidatus Cloacimonadota bacterium]